MRNLRLYNTDAAFKAHEQAAGGDGNDTVTVVPGVSMSSDQRKRYFNPHDESISVQELKINYYIGDKNIATGNTRVKFVSGVSTDGYAKVAPISGKPYEVSEPYASITLPADSSTTISAKCSPNFYIKCIYSATTSSSRIRIYNTKPSYLWGMIVDGETFVTGNSMSTGYTFSTTGEHEITFCFSGSNVTLSNVFSYCYNLKSVEINGAFKSLGSSFYNCTALESVTIPDSVTSIGDSCFSNCKSLKNITIPDEVTSIGIECFYSCSSLKSIVIPDSVTTIGATCFLGCGSLRSIILPSGITSLGANCFNSCSSLQEITIPSGVTVVGDYCFQYCSSLKRIICNASVAPTVYQSTFYNVAKNGTLFYPSGSDYSTWLANATYYLGLYNWTGQEL